VPGDCFGSAGSAVGWADAATADTNGRERVRHDD